MTLLSGIILGHHFILILGIGWLAVRLFVLGQKQVIIVTLIITIAFSSFCCLHQQRVNKLRVNQPEKVSVVVRVYPDQIKVNGDQYQLVGKKKDTNEVIQVYGRIKTPAEQHRIKNINKCVNWHIKGTIEPVAIPTNENQFDMQKYMEFHHIYNQLTVQQIQGSSFAPVTILQIFLDSCHEIRYGLANYFASMPLMVRIYCNSLLIGNNLSEFSTVMSGIKQLGLIHLFSISGMHVFLFVSLVRKVLIYAWLKREHIDWILIFILPAYLIIGGGSSGLVRAVLMAEISLLCRKSAMQLSRADVWSLSLAAGLLYQPLVLLTLGGQLSYLLSFILHFLPSNRPLVSAVLMNLVGLPSILYYIYEWHCLSLLASYLMIPFFSAVIFPLIILSFMTFWFLPIIAEYSNQFLVLFQTLIDRIGSLPGMVHFGKPSIIMSFILFFVTIMLIIYPIDKRVWLGLTMVYGIFFIFIHYPLTGEVTFFDIGQGDCFLIREPFNSSVTLIDTGGQLNFMKPRWAQGTAPTSRAVRTSINYLKSRGINRINNICLSHKDADHVGYTSDVLANMKVDQILFPDGMEKQTNFTNKILPVASRQKTKLIPVRAGQKIDNLPLEIIHPYHTGEGGNEDSMVLVGSVAHLRFMFMGDLDRQGERKILQKTPGLTTDVLKLGHHGSKTASDPRFIKKVCPSLAIISAGRMNRYGHPNQETMKTLKKYEIPSISTQQYGMITYRYDVFGHTGWQTTLKGNELKWMLPPYSNS